MQWSCVVLLLVLLEENVYVQGFTVQQASDYLLKFGYTNKNTMFNSASTSDAGHSVVKLRDAITKFQKFAGLPTTGELDSVTSSKMSQPRCGVPDVQFLTREQMQKWPKNELTYSVDKFPAELPAEDIRDALAGGFRVWSAVTPLVFREIARGGEIQVKFARKRHGDPWPFDGRGGVLAHATLPTGGLLHFDLDEKWVYMDPEKIAKYDTTDLLSVAIHEIGHVIGLEHSREPNSVMAPFYQDTVDRNGNYKMPKLSAGDIRNIQEIYGPPDNTHSGDDRTPTAGSGGGTKTRGPSTDGTTWNGICPTEVDAITTAANSITYLFHISKVYELAGASTIVRLHSLKKIFPNGPPYVQAALTNKQTGKTLLFHDKKVYRYTQDGRAQSFKLDRGFPKRLPSNLLFKPMGAFSSLNGRQFLLNANNFAIYDDDWNVVATQSKVSSYFLDFPRKIIRGAITDQNKMILFGNSEVYKYDENRHRMIGEATPLRFYLNC